MNIFKNFSIKQRFIILFFICITTFIGFGAFSLLKLNNLVQLTQNLYDQSLKISDATVNAKVNLVKMNKAMKDVILSSDTDEIQNEVNKVTQYESELQKNLDTIGENSIDSNIKRNLQDANNLLSKWWKPEREKIIKYMKESEKDKAIEISKGISEDFVEQLEIDLNNIYTNSSENERELIKEANNLQATAKTTLIITLVVLISLLLILFILIMKSILAPIHGLRDHMIKISNSGDLEEYEIFQKNEVGEMANNYNILINKLKNEFWINDNRNCLNDELVGTMSIKELTQRTINFLSRTLAAGSGTFYVYNSKDNNLILNSSFAFTERDRLSNIYKLGEGIIGQVALERKGILLKDIKKSEASICTGTMQEVPNNVYAFPLIYEGELYGVIELASFEPFSNLKKQFIEATSTLIAISLYSAIQNEKIKELLEISEKATKEARNKSIQLKNVNEELEEQQRQLQVQTEELQQTNAQLEEQQQILQQQSEELQQTNSQLEENQLHMEEQSRLLNIKNEELEKSREEILVRSKDYEIANRYKSQFLATVSHELRTPLNSIILLSNLLMRNENGSNQRDIREKIKVIYNSGQNLLSLINDILDLSKIEAGKMDLNYTYFNSEELINELKEMFESTATDKDIQFVLEDSFKNNVYGDKDRISQVLRNFLSNAFKFTEKGSVKLKIASDNEGKDKIIFTVMDTGIGITKENVETIFKEFHQADGSILRKYGGTGLGLSICKKLCELMNGEIKVVSEVNIGSQFSLCLPLITLEDEYFKQEVAVTKFSGFNEVGGEDKYKNLLIIEDDVNLVQSIKTISEGIGFMTFAANNGMDGLNIVKEKEIHGILLDLGLPDVDGIDLLKEIRNILNAKNLNIPIIIYTGMEISKEQESEIKLYAESLIIKTTNSHERLLDELTLMLRRVNSEKQYENIITSKINKDSALNLDNKKILIVDDDPRNVFVISAVFEEYGGDVIEAENGKIALEKLEEEVVDLILMDIMMPVMNGYETIKYIRNNDKTKHIPIIATTAKSLKGDRERCMDAGANDYISKPIDYDVLITLIKAWINKV